MNKEGWEVPSGQEDPDLAAWLCREVERAIGMPAARIGPGQPLTSQGLDSLAAVELQQAIQEQHGVEVSLEDLLGGATIAEVVEEIAARRPVSRRELEQAGAAEGEFPLSHGQRALWFLARLAPESRAYHIAAAARVEGPLFPALLRRAAAALADRHPALRTTFGEQEGEPFQRVHVHLEPSFVHEDARSWSEDELREHLHAEAGRPFDLASGPLLRIGLWTLSPAGHALLLAVHHLVADFQSLEILVRDLGDLYRREIEGTGPLALAPRHSYADFRRWQERRLAGAEGKRLWELWRESLAGAPPALDLPLDRPRPPVQTYRGAAVPSRLGPQLATRVRMLAASRGGTLFATLLAAFQALLARTTGQEDLVVGVPAAGRGAAEFANVVGYFVNPVVVRVDASGDPPFTELLARSLRALTAALDHQDFPFPLLAERLQPERDPGRSPLFQAMLVMQRARHPEVRDLAAFALGEPGGRVEAGGLVLLSLPLEERSSQVDLSLRAAELGSDLALSLQYNTDLFEPATAHRILGQLAVLLEGAAAEPGRPLSTLPLLSSGERAQMLIEWNATAAEWRRDVGLQELIALQAARTPEVVAVESGTGPESLTYAELALRVNRLARHLREHGVGPEVRVGVLLERSPELPVALLAVLATGGCYVPLDPTYPDERLAFMLADSGAALLLTEERRLERVPAGVAAIALDRDRGPIAARDGSPLRATTDPRHLAYVIYTSGSTGRPKGVAIEHRSAVAFVHWAGRAFAPEELAGVLASTSICFDLSIFELFVPLCHGGRVILVRDALELPEVPAGRGVTLLNTVPSAAAELVRLGRLPATLRTVSLAGEPLPGALVERLYALGTVRRVLNLYGPSEDTTYSTGAGLAAGTGREPSIGRPLANTRVYLLDRRGMPVPLGAVGEIHLAGEGLARGYLGRPELTAERFIPDPFAAAPGGRLYRTGDLARYRPDGEIVFLGRADLQIKLRGYRIELGEVESALASLPGVREAVVVARRDYGSDPRLVAYAAVDGDLGAEPLRRVLGERLPAFLVPSAIVLLSALPRTPNGKVDRAALPVPGEARPGWSFTPPRTPVEEMLCGIWSEVIGVDRVGIEDRFFDLGGHSLLATRVVARVREALEVELPLQRVFELPTVAGLAAEIERLRRAGRGALPIPRGAGDGPSPLSFAQRRLWFLHRLAPASAAYNVPLAVSLDGPLAPPSLAGALAGLAHRHEELRARFRDSGGEPVQETAPAAEPVLPLVDLSGLPAAARPAVAAALAAEEARRTFDLSRGPVWRSCLLRLGAREHTLLLTFHHIVCDAWSIGILLREAALLYGAARDGGRAVLPELPVRYADYAAWQLHVLAGPDLDKARSWWRDRLAGLEPLALPADRPQPAVRSDRGALWTGALPAELAGAVRRLGRRQGTTLFMTLLAAFQALLFRLSGQGDAAVGSPVAGRTRPELEGLVGFFVNTLVLRTRLSAGMSFVDAMAEARGAALGAYAHQDVPFELLVEDLQPVRDPGSTPLFRVFFALQNVPVTPPAAGGLVWTPQGGTTGTAKFDLSLFVWESGGAALDLEAEYATDLFDGPTIARLLHQLGSLLRAATADSAAEIADLPLLDEAESFQVLIEWNDTATSPGEAVALHDLFASQAARTPDAPAVRAGDLTLTYRELAERVSRLAAKLRALGVGPEARVGVFARRGAGMIAGLLAVLEAGGAYVPLDPGSPPRRAGDVLADSGASVLLLERELGATLPASLPLLRQVLLDGPEEEPRTWPVPSRVQPGNLAYIIYTSGSTGRPKGVAIEHRSAVALVRWAVEAFAPGETAAVLAATSIGFDLSVFEIFVALSRGGTVVVADGILALPAATAPVTLVNTVPSAMAELLRTGGLPAGVRTVNLAGEPLPAALVEDLFRQPGVERVLNLYGPSEDTTYSTCAVLAPGTGRAPSIGRPIANTRAYLLDSRMRPLPPGTPGELFLAGAGLARGYLGRPDLTADRFRPDPFDPGARVYRTGDLVRQRPDGALEFLGRLDHQVKIHGFRIELDEVASALAVHPSVREAVVVAAGAAADPLHRRLVAYVVPGEGATAGAPELRRHLAERLPAPMVPAVFVFLAELPRTTSGKVDRGALPAPPETAPASAAGRPPRGALEETIAAIWAEVLDLPRVGAEDDFFSLGGHSLLAMRCLARLREACGIDLPLRSLFAAPTVAALARAVAGERQGATGVVPPIEPARDAAPAPLSFAQERLWFMAQLEPWSPAYNLSLALEIDGPADPAALRAALGEIVRRHEVLRSRFAAVHGTPEQRVGPAGPFPLPWVGLAALPEDRRRPEALRLAAAEARRSCDLAAGPLLRGMLFDLGRRGSLLLLVTHHIVFDGSHEPFLRELALLCDAARRGVRPALPEPPVQYADFARWQRRWMDAERLASRLGFWREELAGVPVLELPTDRPRTVDSRRPGALRELALGAPLTARLEDLGRSAGATLYMTMLAVFQVLLGRSTGQGDFAVGSPVADRPRPECEELIGCFTNNLVLRSRLAGGLSFRDLLARVRATVLDAHAHRDVPFEMLVGELQPERTLTHTPLFQVMLSLIEAGLAPEDLAVLGGPASLLQIHGGTARFDLLLALWREASGLAGALEYRSDLFDATTAERFLGHFRNLAAAAAAAPERRTSDLPLLTEAEDHQVRAEWNDTIGEAPGGSLQELFEAQAAARPDAVAAVCGEVAWSYGELDRRANRLAHRLRALGVGRGSFVAVFLARSCETLAALLGILKSGAAYVPLDTGHPEARVRWILASSGIRHAVTDRLWLQPLLEMAASELREVVCLGDGPAIPQAPGPRIWTAADLADPPAPSPANGSDDAAYVIFTSGSTGRPKGVLVRHGPAVNLVDWVNRTFAVGPGDRLLFVTSLCFDLSVYDVFGILAAGATVRVASDAEAGDAERLMRILATEPITFWDSAPAALQQLVPFFRPVPQSPLRLVFLSGDWIPLPLPGEVRAAFPRARVVSLGGATEATVWSNVFPVGRIDPSWPSIPYGRPIRNAVYRILDGDLSPCPVTVPGDLYIGGPCLAAGYAADPGQTAEKFLPDPWCGTPGQPVAGSVLYRTGDRARFRADGIIEFLGRIDHQVKIRGFRIELGEIESALGEHPAVRHAVAVAVAREDAPGDKRLVAYVVPRAGETLSPGELKAFLAARLPDYMQPAAIVLLDSLPMTANGKLDRKALPAPERSRQDAGGFTAPRTPVEEMLAALWADALSVGRVGVHDDIFDLGGHSLLATRVVSSLRAVFRVDLPLRTLFESPTVAGQAQAVEALRRAGPELTAPPLEPQPRDGPPPLSFAQERLWFMDRLVPDSPVYNVYQALRVDGPLDVAALAASVERVVARHEVLRTTFGIVAGRPVQVASSRGGIAPATIDLGGLPPALRAAELDRLAAREARRPFDLGRGPLLRLTLVRLERERHALLLTLHHIVADDWSVGLLVSELAAGYRPGEPAPAPAPPLPLQYADFAIWQRRWLEGGTLAPQLAYWKERLGGELPVLALPTDRPRPPVQSFRGAVLPFAMPPGLSRSVRELARSTDHTLFMVLLAAYAGALGRRARQDDLVVGIAVAGRNRAGIEDLIGFFVNILPLRIDLSGEPAWRELLERVHETALGAYDHQEMPFEKLVEALDPKRDMSRAALRQVGFAFQNTSMRPIAFPGGLEITPIEVDAGVARLDLTLFLWDDGQALRGRCEYATDLFDRGTIAGFVAELERACEEMVADLDRRLSLPIEIRSAAAPGTEGSNLTEGQLLFWFAQKIHAEDRLYFDRAAVTFTVDGELDPGHFARAFAALVERCDTLRTRFREVDGVPLRIVADGPVEPLELLDLSGEPDPEAAFARWLDARGRAPIDLARRPYDSALVRIARDRTVWFFNAHHIIMDATSLVLVARHLSELYALSLAGRLAEAPEIPAFERYVEAERAYRSSTAYQRSAEYWRRKLAAPLAGSDFHRRGAGAQTAQTERITIDLGGERSLRVQEVCRQGAYYSPSVLFGAALFAYLFRSGGEPGQRIGAPFVNRSEDAEGVIGLIMHACVLAVEVEGREGFLALGTRVQQDAVESARHQRCPVRNLPGHRAYDVYFNYQSMSFGELCGHPVRFELLRSGSSNEALVLQVRDFNREGKLYLDLDLNLGSFPEAEQRERSAGHFLRLLDAFLADPAIPVGAPALLSAAEVEEIAHGFNRTRRVYAEGAATLHDLIVAQTGRTPEALAVTSEGGSLTYGELLARALRLAGLLQSRGVGPDSVVGISVERSCELPVGLLGILLAGGAYLPLDPNDPPRRLEQTLEDSGVSLLLIQERLAGRFAGSVADMILLDGEEGRAEHAAWARPAVDGDSLAYVIYTSGSTGRPKGVMVPHRGIVNRLLWMQEEYGLDASDRVLQKTPVSFDVSVWELFWPLITGARLVMARPGGHRDAGYLADVIAAEGITTLHFVPSMLQVFLDQEGLDRCSSVKRVICSGEALPESLRARFHERLASHPGLHNLYGPTEASVDVTFWPCERENPLGFVPIGMPIANTSIHIADRWAHLSPKGLPGELWIGGVGLARGYLRRPDLTAERFVPDPWSDEPGARAYRTGDLARRLPDGVLEFLGRLDHQVKIRGFRIELGEIEAALAEHPDLKEVVVTAREDRPGDLRLVAYLVPRPARTPAIAELRSGLRERLPEHMVPAAWVVLEALPLSATGKVDRKALPPPERQASAEGVYVAPRTPVEALLAGICAQVLGLERVGIHDDFFDLGGSSILATQVVTTVQEILPVDLPLRNVFETPTVAQIAELLEERFRALDEEDRASVGEVLAELERLTGTAGTAGEETAQGAGA